MKEHAGMRKERDSLGEMYLEDSVYYGIQTQRAKENFQVSDTSTAAYPHYIQNVVLIKKAAAMANCDIRALEKDIAEAVVKAADEVISGSYMDQFPLDVLQGGGGTSTNMNVNEVLANIAGEMKYGRKNAPEIHPNTHVNMCQSTNDVIPSAIKLTCWHYIGDLVESIKVLEAELEKKTQQFAKVVKLGRTCLQDALPLTLGQEFSGYASLVKRQREQLERIRPEFLSIPLGGTAVGTGALAEPGYLQRVYIRLAECTGLEVRRDENFFDGLQNADMYITLSAALKGLSAGISKISRDLRLLSSGPRAGLGEIILPALQPGSSMMPGKVNPVLPELMRQIWFKVCGNDLSVTLAAEDGELDLNIWEPVITACLFESFALLTRSIPVFARRCIAGIEAREEVCSSYAGSSLALSSVIASRFDYPTGAKTASYAAQQNITAAQAAVELGLVTQEEADQLFDPRRMVHPPDEPDS